MRTKILWDEQEAVLLLDAYEKIEQNPKKKDAIINALSINLRRRARDKKIVIDDIFRNYAGIKMRLLEIEKILHPEGAGLTNTSQLFRETAKIYQNDRNRFIDKLQTVEEYCVKIIGSNGKFDLYEAAVLLDGYFSIVMMGLNTTEVASTLSMKLRTLAVNRGSVITNTFRSQMGILNRLRNIGVAYRNYNLNDKNSPRIFTEIIKIYNTDRDRYNELLETTNAIIGQIHLQRNTVKLDTNTQPQKDVLPMEEIKYFKNQADYNLNAMYPNEFTAVYDALEKRSYTAGIGVNVMQIYLDLNERYKLKTIIDILENASWSKKIRAGMYVHALKEVMTAVREENEKKFFVWLKSRVTQLQYETIEKNKDTIIMNLQLRKIISKSIFLMEDIADIQKAIAKMSHCNLDEKLKAASVKLFMMYVTYLEEQTPTTSNIEINNEKRQNSGETIESILSEPIFTFLKTELERQRIKTLEELKSLDLWAFMNRFNLYSIGTRQTVFTKVQMLLNAMNSYKDSGVFVLVVDKEEFRGQTPAETFLRFCESMVATYPLRFRGLIGFRMRDRGYVPLNQKMLSDDWLKVPGVKAHIDNNLSSELVLDYVRWVCKRCSRSGENIRFETITNTVEKTISQPRMESPTAIHPPKQIEQPQTGQPTTTIQLPQKIEQPPRVDCKVEKRDDMLIQKLERIVLQSDLEGISYVDIRLKLGTTATITRQLVAESMKIVEIKSRLFHEEAFVDWEDAADELEDITDKLMQKNNGYISSSQLFQYVRSEMNMFLNDNDLCEERAVYDITRHFFEKVRYHGKEYAFHSNTHISPVNEKVSSNMDVIKKYVAEQGGIFSLSELGEHLRRIGLSGDNLRAQLNVPYGKNFFLYDSEYLISSEAMNINEEWTLAVQKALNMLFEDVGDHIILRKVPAIWFERMPSLPNNQPWTTLLFQSLLRVYGEDVGARTIPAMEGQSAATLHTMLVTNDSEIQNFGDVVISHLFESEISQNIFKAEDLRLVLVDAGIIQGGELLGNLPKALKGDTRFAWDLNGEHVTVRK